MMSTHKSAPSNTLPRRVALAGALALASASATLAADAPPGAQHRPVMQQALPNVPGDSLTAVVVQLAPGAVVPAHHHAGIVFAYVLSGTVRSQLNGGAARDYGVGQSWTEPPGTEHTLTANPSRTEPTSLLSVFRGAHRRRTHHSGTRSGGTEVATA